MFLYGFLDAKVQHFWEMSFNIFDISFDKVGMANSYFEVLGEKATHKKLTEVNGDAVEEEVTISSSIVDGDKSLEVLVECFC